MKLHLKYEKSLIIIFLSLMIYGIPNHPADADHPCQSKSSLPDTGSAVIESDNLCLVGPTDKSMLDDISCVNLSHIRTITLRSPGGDVQTALQIAEIMRKSAAEVIVNDICVSSCANYLFLAAGERRILHGAVLGIHGGPPPVELYRKKNFAYFRQTVIDYNTKNKTNFDPEKEFAKRMQHYQRNILDIQVKFYKEVGVNIDLIDAYLQRKVELALKEGRVYPGNPRGTFWVPRLADLEAMKVRVREYPLDSASILQKILHERGLEFQLFN